MNKKTKLKTELDLIMLGHVQTKVIDKIESIILDTFSTYSGIGVIKAKGIRYDTLDMKINGKVSENLLRMFSPIASIINGYVGR